MEKSFQEALDRASWHLRQAKLAIYSAEEQAANERKNEINQIWWATDDLHKRVEKLM